MYETEFDADGSRQQPCSTGVSAETARATRLMGIFFDSRIRTDAILSKVATMALVGSSRAPVVTSVDLAREIGHRDAASTKGIPMKRSLFL